jgi:membrane protease YdiL (CAAX protease family)
LSCAQGCHGALAHLRLNPRSFFLAADGRLHPPWRILLFLLLCASCIFVVTLALNPLLRALDGAIGIRGAGSAYGTTIALLLAHWMTFRSFDERPAAFVGLDRSAARTPTMLHGWILGAAPIALATLALIALGLLDVVPAPAGSWLASAIQISLLLVPAALYEELLARGYIFATLREWLGWPAAIALTSAGFGLMHVPNPGENWLPIFVVTLAGVYLGAVLMATRSLYAAWMAHWAWNTVMAVGLHIAVSGLPFATPWYRTVEDGPDWITGGEWGPEGGVAAAMGMLGGLGYLYWRWRRVQRLDDTVER